jgi:hypothetical protein
MAQFRDQFYHMQHRKGRNDNRIWLLVKLLKWTKVDLPIETISLAGGQRDSSTDMGLVFANCDRGVQNIKDWCDSQCRKPWRYEPSGTFLFRSMNDAAIFKLRWF